MKRFAACGRLFSLVVGLVVIVAALPMVVRAEPANMIYVSGGSFTMGRDVSGYREMIEGPAHQVTVSSFYIGKYDVTFSEYDSFCKATGRKLPGDYGWGRDKRPVINVSWYDAVDYCNWRSQQEGLTPAYNGNGKNVACDFTTNGYRLPTEAEWEYAARGGSQSRGYSYSGSDNIYDVGLGYGTRTHPVGMKLPNELGIYDMSGNVWQWCWDWYDKDYYHSSPADNPAGPVWGVYRVKRGGDFVFAGGGVNVFDRSGDVPSLRSWFIGFRLVRTK